MRSLYCAHDERASHQSASWAINHNQHHRTRSASSISRSRWRAISACLLRSDATDMAPCWPVTPLLMLMEATGTQSSRRDEFREPHPMLSLKNSSDASYAEERSYGRRQKEARRGQVEQAERACNKCHRATIHRELERAGSCASPEALFTRTCEVKRYKASADTSSTTATALGMPCSRRPCPAPCTLWYGYGRMMVAWLPTRMEHLSLKAYNIRRPLLAPPFCHYATLLSTRPHRGLSSHISNPVP